MTPEGCSAALVQLFKQMRVTGLRAGNSGYLGTSHIIVCHFHNECIACRDEATHDHGTVLANLSDIMREGMKGRVDRGGPNLETSSSAFHELMLGAVRERCSHIRHGHGWMA